MKSSFLLLSRVFDEIFTFEKQAPICTLGVGGKPLEMGCCCCFKGSPLRLPEFSMPVGDDLLADLSRRRGGALGEVLDPSSEKETQEIILLPDFSLIYRVSQQVLDRDLEKNLKKSQKTENLFTFELQNSLQFDDFFCTKNFEFCEFDIFIL